MRRTTRGDHGLSKVSPEPAMHDPFTPCGRATPNMALQPVFYPFGHPTPYAYFFVMHLCLLFNFSFSISRFVVHETAFGESSLDADGSRDLASWSCDVKEQILNIPGRVINAILNIPLGGIYLTRNIPSHSWLNFMGYPEGV
jgi:hypothetical protein